MTFYNVITMHKYIHSYVRYVLDGFRNITLTAFAFTYMNITHTLFVRMTKPSTHHGSSDSSLCTCMYSCYMKQFT